jgi:hypothetical protein
LVQVTIFVYLIKWQTGTIDGIRLKKQASPAPDGKDCKTATSPTTSPQAYLQHIISTMSEVNLQLFICKQFFKTLMPSDHQNVLISFIFELIFLSNLGSG